MNEEVRWTGWRDIEDASVPGQRTSTAPTPWLCCVRWLSHVSALPEASVSSLFWTWLDGEIGERTGDGRGVYKAAPVRRLFRISSSLPTSSAAYKPALLSVPTTTLAPHSRPSTYSADSSQLCPHAELTDNNLDIKTDAPLAVLSSEFTTGPIHSIYFFTCFPSCTRSRSVASEVYSSRAIYPSRYVHSLASRSLPFEPLPQLTGTVHHSLAPPPRRESRASSPCGSRASSR